MGFFGQLVAYLRALAFETVTGAILLSDVVALLVLVAFPHLATKLTTGTWFLIIAIVGYAIGNFQLYRRHDPMLPAGAASIELASLNPQARKVGIEALFELSIDRHGGLARRVLARAALHHQWADVRRSATIRLGEVTICRRHEAVLNRDAATKSHWQREARYILARSAGYIRELTVVRALGILLADLQRTAPVEERLHAAKLLGQIPSRSSIQYLTVVANRPFVRHLDDATDETQARIAAVEALGRIGGRVISVLAELTEDEDLGAAAIGSLAELGEAGSHDREMGIKELLRRAAEGQHAIEGTLLGRRDLPERIKPFLHDPQLGPKTADLLGQLLASQPMSTTTLPCEGIRISQPRDPRKSQAEVALEWGVREGAEATRRCCARALGRGSLGVWGLIRLLDDRREDALAGLASAAASATEGWELFEHSTTVIPRILVSLNSGTEAVRATAAEALGALRAVTTIGDLARLAADPTVPEPVRLAAINGLGRMASNAAVPPLLAIARDPASATQLVSKAQGALRLLESGPELWSSKDRVPEAREALNEIGDN
jgi:HEAT repeat protein